MATDKKTGKQQNRTDKMLGKRTITKKPLNSYHNHHTPCNQGSNTLKATAWEHTPLSALFWDLEFIQHDFGLHCPICEPRTSVKEIVGVALQFP